MASMGLGRVAAVLLVPCALSCSSGSSDRANPFGGSGATTGAGAATGAGGSDGVGGGFIDPGSSGGGGPTDPNDPGGCGGDQYVAEQSQLDMYIVVDRSTSMLIPFIVDLWTPVGMALGTFVVDANAAGIAAGITFFPPSGGDACNPATYSNPVVPIGILPANGPAIQNAIVNNIPGLGDGTPTLPAMRGAVDHALAHSAANPDSATIVVLATDGEPNGCGSNVGAVSQEAARGLAGGIRTFVIGLGNIAGLNQIAAEGGGQSILVDPDPAVTNQQFLDAMNQIRGIALPCDYALPAGTTDPGKVNLSYTDAGGQSQFVPNVGDASGCGPDGGWYYDNAAAPQRILTCDQTCSTFKSISDATVNVVLGCTTIVK